MRRLLPVLFLLALAPSAQAKGVSEMQACGKHRCVDVTKQADEAILGGTPTDGPGGTQPFVELNVTFRGDAPPGEKPPTESFTLQFLPEAGLTLNEDGLWSAPHPTAVAWMRDVAKPLAPFPARKLLQLAPELAQAEAPPPAAPPAPPTAPAPAVDDGGVSIWTLAGIAVVALLAAAATVSVRRRRTMPG